MMSYEEKSTVPTEESEEPEKSDGERWLELLGYGHLKGSWTGYYLGADGKPYTPEQLAEKGIEGKPVPVEEFDKLCGEWARPALRGLERMGPNDPAFPEYLKMVRKKFNSFFTAT